MAEFQFQDPGIVHADSESHCDTCIELGHTVIRHTCPFPTKSQKKKRVQKDKAHTVIMLL